MDDQDSTNLNDGSQPPTKPQSLQTLTSSGPLSSSLSTLSVSSNRIPSNKDFHFYYNFGEFKDPIRQIASQSNDLLDSIGYSSTQLCKKNLRFPTRDDPDEAYDWLVNVNDEIFERFGSSIDEFERIRKKEEGGQGVDDDGFQVVNGKKKKKVFGSSSTSTSEFGNDLGVKVVDRKGVVGGKAKIPFHIAAIRKPQEEYGILVNNSNNRFEHVWLETSEDGSRAVHPLEKLNVLDFVNSCRGAEPVLPQPLESTPFKFVEEVKDLKELAAKLRAVNEFAVDLEHNQYRSFQGLTCLMQISTRTEDFVVDTLKLRVQIGPHLREVFKDPSKKKVFHGADRDILWLQRDFGIYVCNMFDTGQASRVLKLERFSLEFLLQHFCGITANKEYQNADWRLRPLPLEMIKYAREDTHYLLHIYDIMTVLLETMPKDPEQSDSPLIEVYKRSYDVCVQLYERELLTETSYLHLYGLQGAGFNAQQLAVVAGLYEWRDVVGRAEDESTGYILPNKVLLEIAKQMPVTSQMLRRVMKSKLPYVERNLGTIVSIIRHCMQNAGAFEAAAQQLKEARVETAPAEHVENDGDEDGATDIGSTEEISGGYLNDRRSANVQSEKKHLGNESNLSRSNVGQGSQSVENGTVKICGLEGPRRSTSVTLQAGGASARPSVPSVSKARVASVQVQVQKKPTGGFGALLGSKVAKRNPDVGAKEKELAKLEKIRSSVSLPFYSIPTENNVSNSDRQEPNQATEASDSKEAESKFSGRSSKLEDIMMLEDNSEEFSENSADSEPEPMKADKSAVSASETNDKDGAVSLSDLSTSFEKCFQTIDQANKSQKAMKQNEELKLKPFDYATARQQVKFGENAGERSDAANDRKHRGQLRKGSTLEQSDKDSAAGEFKQGKRRQAFPASGNRSATFR